MNDRLECGRRALAIATTVAVLLGLAALAVPDVRLGIAMSPFAMLGFAEGVVIYWCASHLAV
jgi:hypothetical protein